MRRLAAVLLAIGMVTWGRPASAQTTAEPTVSGTLQMVWGDPEDDGVPRYHAFVTDAAGVVHPFAVDGRDQPLVATLIQANGQRVVARGRELPALLGDGRRGLPVPVLAEVRVEPDAFLPAHSTAPAWAVTTRPYAVILCKFADIATETLPRQRYVDMYANAPGGTDAFFREASRGRLTLEGTTVFGWYTLPKPRAGYTNAAGEADLGLLATDCLGVADADVDFSKFGGVGTHYNSRIGCCSWGGGWTTALDGPSRGMPFMWNMDWARSGTVAHEAGHSFGLPHSSGPYGAVYDSQWDVMSSSSSGSYLNADFGRAGSQFIGAYKDRLGLIPDSAKVVLSGGRWSGVVEPHSRAAGRNPQLIILPMPSARANVWMTIEARQRVGSDRSIPGEGVVIATVDNSRSEPGQVIDADGNGDPNDAGAIWTVGERYEDAARGVVMTVDSLTANGLSITVERTGAGAAGLSGLARFERAGISREFAANDTTIRRDSVRVLASGPWAVYNPTVPTWLHLFRREGTGNGWMVYGIRPAAARSGRSVVSLLLPAPRGLTPIPFTIELGILAGNAADAALLSRAGRRVSTLANGSWGSLDTLRLLVGGSWTTAAWTIRTSSNIYTIDAAGQGYSTRSGTGPMSVAFLRRPRQTAGTSIDTVRVEITAPVARTLLVVDTVEYATAASGVTLGSRRGAIARAIGAPSQIDSVQVLLGNTQGVWNAGRRRSDTQLLRSVGFHGDWLVWMRVPSAIGSSVDTISVIVNDGTSTTFVDSMNVNDAATRVVLSRSGGSQTITLGRSWTTDSVQVGILGRAGASLTWSATSTEPSLLLQRRDAFTTAATGTVRNFVRFNRILPLLAPGRYIDTITVNLVDAMTAPALYIDTTTVLAPPVVAGDADVNGTVNAADGMTVLRSLVQLPVSPRANVRVGGDANCDGTITVADAVILLQVDAGIIPAANCVGRPGG
jgi:hypothetical protein